MTEFELIRTYFASQSLFRSDVRVGIGDDAALVGAPSGMETAITTDVLVAGVHFFEDVDPSALGHKSLAVNLSDLAAMGAEPAWFLLNLTLPVVNAVWLRDFAEGMSALARHHRIQLIGGDTSRGPLSIGITAIGFVPKDKGLLRSGARPGDAIYVTGTLGDAALSLSDRKAQVTVSPQLRDRLERPIPRVAEGIALRDVASSAIDISDGLLADLGHILEASQVGARLRLDSIPLSSAYRSRLATAGWDYALAGGDDYELCFTVPANKLQDVDVLAKQKNFSFTSVGQIIPEKIIDIRDGRDQVYHPARKGHDHFANK